MKHTIKSLALAAALLFGAAGAHANLLANGDFETGDASGWTEGGNTLFNFFDPAAAHTGNYGAAFGAPSSLPATLSQTFATVAGQQYRLSFWLQNNEAGSAAEPNSFELRWAGAVQASLSDAAAFGYTEYVYTLTAAAASTELSFGFGHHTWYWELDDVAVTAVPEAAAAAQLALGLLVCAAVVRAKRRPR